MTESTSKKRSLPEEFINPVEEPAPKEARTAEGTGLYPRTAIACNARALAFYKELDAINWKYSYVSSIGFKEVTVKVPSYVKRIEVCFTRQPLRKPNVLQHMRACRSLILTSDFIPDDPYLYRDMTPLIQAQLAVQPQNEAALAALDDFCQNVEVELSHLVAVAKPFAGIEEKFKSVYPPEAETETPMYTILTLYWPLVERAFDIGMPTFHFRATEESQRQVLPLLNSIRDQRCFSA